MRSMRQIFIKAAATAFVLIVLVIALRYALADPNAISHLNVCYTQSGPAQYMDIFEPGDTSRPHPVVVAIHGGGWSTGSRVSYRGAMAHFVTLGYVFATIDYRLTGVAPYPAQIEDCKCAIRFLRAHAAQYHIDPNQVGVWGESAGGHLVALLGTTGETRELDGTGGWQDQSSAVQAVVDCFGPTDLRADHIGDYNPEIVHQVVTPLFGPDQAAWPSLAAKASPVVFVSKASAPILIMHGDADPVVPISQSREFYQALKSAGVDATIKILPGAKHGGPAFYAPESIQLVDDFFRRILKPDTAQP